MSTSIGTNSSTLATEIKNGSIVGVSIDTAGNVYNKDGSLLTSTANFTGTNVSLAANGYQKLPSGLIMQWGIGNDGTTPAFPIAFPSQCLSVTMATATTSYGTPRALSVTKTNFTIAFANYAGGSAFWIAIGY